MSWKKLLYQLTKIAASPTTYDRGKDWAHWDGKRWHFDCCRLIKSVLWGFDFQKDKNHGGAVYKAGYPDYTTEQMITACDRVSEDMKTIEPGELLWFRGHVGIYIGNGNVVECAPSLRGVAVTSINYQPWKKHGFIREVEYEAPEPAPKPVRVEGEAISLVNEPLYASSTRKTPSNHVTGTYYLIDGKLFANNRVRIGDEPDDAGHVNMTIGYIDWRWD